MARRESSDVVIASNLKFKSRPLGVSILHNYTYLPIRSSSI